jgi:hypothetical protein
VLQARRELLTLHSLGAAYGRRPSELVGIADEWAAYQFDAACLTLGRRIEAAVIKNEDITAILDGQPAQPDPSRFSNVGHLVSRKIKIPESGVW